MSFPGAEKSFEEAAAVLAGIKQGIVRTLLCNMLQ
jgi:hypothetical protein